MDLFGWIGRPKSCAGLAVKIIHPLECVSLTPLVVVELCLYSRLPALVFVQEPTHSASIYRTIRLHFQSVHPSESVERMVDDTLMISYRT